MTASKFNIVNYYLELKILTQIGGLIGSRILWIALHKLSYFLTLTSKMLINNFTSWGIANQDRSQHYKYPLIEYIHTLCTVCMWDKDCGWFICTLNNIKTMYVWGQTCMCGSKQTLYRYIYSINLKTFWSTRPFNWTILWT